MTRPFGSSAVMAARRSPPKALDYFPTPPWATRALVEHVLYRKFGGGLAFLDKTVWEPAAGEGHMAETLKEYFGVTLATDVFDYGRGYPTIDFLDPLVAVQKNVDYVITNPPFNTASQFAIKALKGGVKGVFLLLRTAWLESDGRYQEIFSKRPPTIIAQFVERVPMVAGRYDPKARSATAYAWFGWVPRVPYGETQFVWIPPCRAQLERPDDIRRWCAPADAPLLDGAAG